MAFSTIVQRFRRLLLFTWILCYAGQVSSNPGDPEGSRAFKEWGIEADFPGQDNYYFTSYTSLADLFREAEEQRSVKRLANVARQAYAEMTKLHFMLGRGKPKLPTVMTVLFVGDSLYMASSIKEGWDKSYANFKGYLSLNNENLPVLEAMNLCEIEEATHRTGGNCGEMKVADLFFSFQDGPNRRLSYLKEQGGIIITWFRHSNKDFASGYIVPPCNPTGDEPEPKYGCKQFVEKLGINAVEERLEPLDDYYHVDNADYPHYNVHGTFQYRELETMPNWPGPFDPGRGSVSNLASTSG